MPHVSSVKRRATHDDLVKVPDTMVAEILDGELFASPRPAAPHALAGSMLGADLIGHFVGPPGGGAKPGGWWLLYEPELHLGEDVVVPDWAGWRRERMPIVPDVSAFTVAPDVVIEIVSPSTEAIDRGRKMRIYAREGVHHLWIIDPVTRTLEVHRLNEGRWAVAKTFTGSDAIRGEPFDAVTLEMGRWWREP
ncbi:MAG: Uma2 family endonuclease [Candidatus Binatia bacterium]